jgi:hypothetical protein
MSGYWRPRSARPVHGIDYTLVPRDGGRWPRPVAKSLRWHSVQPEEVARSVTGMPVHLSTGCVERGHQSGQSSLVKEPAHLITQLYQGEPMIDNDKGCETPAGDFAGHGAFRQSLAGGERHRRQISGFEVRGRPLTISVNNRGARRCRLSWSLICPASERLHVDHRLTQRSLPEWELPRPVEQPVIHRIQTFSFISPNVEQRGVLED